MNYKTALRTARKRAITQHPGTNFYYYILRDDRFKGGFTVDCYPDAPNRPPARWRYGYFNKQGEHFIVDLSGYTLTGNGELVKDA